ncbi:MAG: helix-turn-helix transcriptional regulator [Clostridia bacterium]|nr:helix-turn-helix transcriptional regulator [Clostridia bacterium]
MNTRFKEVRKYLHLTQKEVGEEINISESAVSKIEKGTGSPSRQTVTMFCSAYNVNEEWLRTGEGDMFCEPASDELSALCARYKLDALEAAVLKAYLELGEPDRAVMRRFIDGIVENATADASSSDDAPSLDISAEVESYRRQLEAQKKAAEKSSICDLTAEKEA